MTKKSPDAPGILTEKMLKFIDAWQGNAIAAAKAAGYRKPQVVACRLMKNPTIRAEIRRKQIAMSQESGKRLGGQLNFDRSYVLNRLWEIAQIPPDETNRNLGAQVKAAEVLGAMFDAEMKHLAELLPHLPTKSKDDIQFFIHHGHFPQHQENPNDQKA
jgi:phage terminase small subunit